MSKQYPPMAIAQKSRFHYRFWLVVALLGAGWYITLDSAGQSSLLFALYQFMGI